MKYKIVQVQSLHLMESAVTRSIKDGYEPIGGVVINTKPDSVYAYFLQTMVKR